MRYDPEKHHRRSIRLRDYDYSQNGAYFVTICSNNKEHMFGSVHHGEMVLNQYGLIVGDCWKTIHQHFTYVDIDAFIVMPDHVHGIVVIDKPVGAQHAAPLLGIVIRSFKSAVTKSINLLRNTPGASVWQRNYYEHIIRNDSDLDAIRKYIANNPARWQHK